MVARWERVLDTVQRVLLRKKRFSERLKETEDGTGEHSFGV
jgi:hypothetical protein